MAQVYTLFRQLRSGVQRLVAVYTSLDAAIEGGRRFQEDHMFDMWGKFLFVVSYDADHTPMNFKEKKLIHWQSGLLSGCTYKGVRSYEHKNEYFAYKLKKGMEPRYVEIRA